jgi:hypothetical protein
MLIGQSKQLKHKGWNLQACSTHQPGWPLHIQVVFALKIAWQSHYTSDLNCKSPMLYYGSLLLFSSDAHQANYLDTSALTYIHWLVHAHMPLVE